MFKRKRGAQSMWLAPALSAGFGAGATAAGFGAFAPAASAFGGYLGQKFKDITGYGDYSINQNSLLSGTVPGVSNPQTKDGLCISHKEYIGDLLTSTTPNSFNIQKFLLNPGDSRTWEWLAQIACNYEQWTPEGIIFYYKSTSGDALNSVNTALGTVIMATQYNPYDPPYKSKAEMESAIFCTNGAPSNDMMHPIECAPNMSALSTLFVRMQNTQNVRDLRFTDLGAFYIATAGFQGTSVNIGEIWVTYQVTLIKPRLFSSLGFYHDYWKMSGSAATNNFNLGNPTSAMVIDPYSNMPMELFDNGSMFTGQAVGRFVQGSTGLSIQCAIGEQFYMFPIYAFPTAYKVIYEVVGQGPNPMAATAWTAMAGDIPSMTYTVIESKQSPQLAANVTNWNSSCVVYVPGGSLQAVGIKPMLHHTFTVINNTAVVTVTIIQLPAYTVANP